MPQKHLQNHPNIRCFRKTKFTIMAYRRNLFIVFVLIASVFCGSVLGVFLSVMHDLPQIRKLEEFTPAAITRIYSAEGAILDELYVKKRHPLAYDEIPPVLIKALIATEDIRFYDHPGLDIKGILRATVKDIIALGFVEGGSTLTQQLAKTLFLTREKTFLRKIREAILSFQIERRYTKKEILTMYLNQVYFGSGAYGVQSAARIFFNKSPDELSVAECALIAGMPKSPSRYSPLNNRELSLRRRNIVLSQMHKNHIINRAEYEKSIQEPLTVAEQDRPRSSAAYFVQYIKPFLKNTVGEQLLYNGGLSVYTTLSLPLQLAAEEALQKGLSALEKRRKQKNRKPPPQGALVALDVDTGGIVAMVGGRDFEKSPFNRAVQARRPPGSAFKPILYACAIHQGFTQAATLLNTPVVFPGATRDKPWKPQNFSEDYSSEMTLRKALVHSKNIPSARLMNQLGPSSVAAFAADLGISSPLSPYLSLALGSSGMSLLELTGAYSVFPRLGKHIKPYGVTRIVDHQGRLLWQGKPASKIVLPAAEAAIVTDMLQGVIQNGTGRRARSLRCPLAGKTGTTDNCKDALFVGYSRKIAAGVWTGTDDYTTLGRRETGARAALPIWMDFMEKTFGTKPCRDFDLPEGVLRIKIDPVTGKRVFENEDGVYALFRKERVSALSYKKRIY